ncbi:GDSL-type esterase/lipase family protein [Leifsonia sp. YAF41]|uniref:GDSL-type esterase/lipase family protein n=1 Tax=Leifsonia sp. YAF41 TaxID=3233086 RepID=UPI003F9EA6FD
MLRSIAFLGDGLIEGGLWQEWFPDFEIHNLGVSGDTTAELKGRLDAVFALQPDAVVLQIGANDLSWHRSDEYIVRNIETILCSIRRQLPTTRILLQSVLPREREFAETIQSINRHLWQFAPTQYAQYLDLWAVLADSDGEIGHALSTDRLHLSAEGYDAWRTKLKPILESLFELPFTTSAIQIQQA